VVVFKLEAAGTAIATIAAQMISFGAAYVFMYRNKEHFDFDFKLKSYKINREALKMLLRLGVPRAIMMTFINLSQMYCSSLVNRYGLVESAVNSVGNKIQRFLNIIIMSIDSSAAVMVGQNLGARNVERAKQAVYSALKVTMGMMVVNILMAIFIPDKIFGLFNNEPDVVALGVRYMRINIIAFVLSAVMGPFQAVVTGSGNAMLNFFSGVLDSVVLRIGISLTLAYVFDMGVIGFFYGNALARFAPFCINIWYFYSGRWTRRHLLDSVKKEPEEEDAQ
jgi:Na+-driven multidrug efflux pump